MTTTASKPKRQKDLVISFRATKRVSQRVDELASYFGRRRGEELRLALAVHDVRATYIHAHTPEGEQEARDAGLDPEEVRNDLGVALTKLEDATYNPKSRLSLTLS